VSLGAVGRNRLESPLRTRVVPGTTQMTVLWWHVTLFASRDKRGRCGRASCSAYEVRSVLVSDAS
jgi:hypothetical protein